MLIKGGVSNTNDHFLINLQIDGGECQKRIYDNNVQDSINRLIIINNTLNKIPIENNSDALFYLNELMTIFRSLYLDFIPTIGSYQITHNINLLLIYINSRVNNFNPNDAIKLLNCNRMISEFNSDCNCDCDEATVMDIIIDDIQVEYNDIIFATKKLRILFNDYMKIIESKKDEIQSTYLEMVNKIKKYLSN
jgi:hypothetical protein